MTSMATQQKPSSPFWKNPRTVCFLIALAAGILFLWPTTYYQDWLSSGDHGRDLDAFEQALNGKAVYTDYWWVYGPLMPHYYALFYKFFGIKISSVLLGKFMINLTAGLVCYLALARLFSPLAALGAAIWFWAFQQDFFFTYNHVGGIVVEMAVIFCLLSYVQLRRMSTLWWAAGWCFVLSMIKVNFGLSSLGTILVAAFLVDRSYKIPFTSQKKLFYFAGIAVFPVVVFFIYWLLLKTLPMYEIRQCLPYSNADQPYNTTPWGAMWGFLKITAGEIKKTPSLLVLYVVMALCAVQAGIVLAKKKMDPAYKKMLTLSMIVLAVYGLANFHEFIKSGVWYRWFWAQPPLIALVLIIFETAAKSLHQTVRVLLWSVLFLLLAINAMAPWKSAISHQIPPQKITGERGGIYVGNGQDWVAPVNVTTEYLKLVLKPGESFFAVPYDILYNYLLARPIPSRQTIFFEHINIPPEQELKIIKEIEAKNINTIVLSNRYRSPEKGLGTLGKTYCPIIGKYIEDNFVVLVRIGYWQVLPGWGWNHGTMILKRK
jgi:hypothetical protein